MKLIEFRWIEPNTPWESKRILQVRHRKVWHDYDSGLWTFPEKLTELDQDNWEPWEEVPTES